MSNQPKPSCTPAPALTAESARIFRFSPDFSRLCAEFYRISTDFTSVFHTPGMYVRQTPCGRQSVYPSQTLRLEGDIGGSSRCVSSNNVTFLVRSHRTPSALVRPGATCHPRTPANTRERPLRHASIRLSAAFGAVDTNLKLHRRNFRRLPTRIM